MLQSAIFVEVNSKFLRFIIGHNPRNRVKMTNLCQNEGQKSAVFSEICD
jgi:hypothetical protein